MTHSGALAHDTITAERFKGGMRCLPGAISIVATEDAGVPAGMTVTAVSSVSADPPMLLVCINQAATSHGPIQRSQRFTINVLGAEDIEIARRFSSGDMQSRFQIGEWVRLPSGGLALGSAAVTFDCKVAGRVQAGTHSIFFGRIEDVRVQSRRTAALVYVDGQYAPVAVADSATASRGR